MKRAVAYIRVSTKSDAQLHSYDYQVDYWQKEIAKNEEYEFKKVYSDFGISGRSLTKRPQLLKLMEDARKKEFDVIFTKSVSRFGRNTEELLTLVRELRELGIKVLFEKENIDTFNVSSEVFLTIAAAVAENDLRIYSENQRWSIRERYKNGFVSVGNKIYGYRMNNQTNTLEVIPEEAKIVKHIYDLYVEGLGIAMIVLRLNEEGIIKDGKQWSRSTISYILTNEKYKGCSLAQKSIKSNGIQKANKGEVKQYYMENVHEAIIDTNQFELVQKLYRERASEVQIGREVIPPYPFTKKLKCGVCGHGYSHKFNNTNKAWRRAIWSCSYQNNYSKKYCDNTLIKDDVLKNMFVEAFNEYVKENKYIDKTSKHQKDLEYLLQQAQELNQLRINHMIELKAYNEEALKLRGKIEMLNKFITKQKIRGVSKDDYNQINEFDDTKVDKFLEYATINHHTITFRFINGVEITKSYTNGASGNQKGWKQKRLNQGKESI